jgi:hypothetical protein
MSIHPQPTGNASGIAPPRAACVELLTGEPAKPRDITVPFHRPRQVARDGVQVRNLIVRPFISPIRLRSRVAVRQRLFAQSNLISLTNHGPQVTNEGAMIKRRPQAMPLTWSERKGRRHSRSVLWVEKSDSAFPPPPTQQGKSTRNLCRVLLSLASVFSLSLTIYIRHVTP